jgi:hypothetical protein
MWKWMMVALVGCALAAVPTAGAAEGADSLEKGFADPPDSAKVRVYWWWLNSNVTKAAITRDLTEMRAKGIGGALICDAGKPAGPTPAGPAFLSPQWRELFKHALREADRLGIELSLNIQSGWNLGGPMVKTEEGFKRVAWCEITATGPAKFAQPLPQPKANLGFYRDIAVLAYRLDGAAAKRFESPFAGIAASSAQPAHPASAACDGDPGTFWVSEGVQPGDGPSPEKPQWLDLRFKAPASADALTVLGRVGYSPRECEVQASDDGKTFRTLKTFTVADGREATAKFDDTSATHFRLLIKTAYDRGQTQTSRNVQVCEIALLSSGRNVSGAAKAARPIRMLDLKTSSREFGGSAPDTSPLLVDDPDQPGEEDVRAKDVALLTDKLDKDGRLRWDVPQGQWQVLRFGCTATGAKVSTFSPGWGGLAIEYLDSDVLRSYWRQVVDPLIADAGPLAGKTLKYFHTDSWECGGVNWTTNFAEEFRQRRGYDLRPYLPVLAGRIVESRSASNRFLNDFRKTIGDCVAENHYRLLAEMSHAHGIGIHPESGGPHGAPVDALRCLGASDVPMMEFWARAKTHRVREEDRLFVKQAASAAHIYGKRIVAAEAFTTIAPHWQETLWDNLKPTFDQEACEGLNRAVVHQFTCSPPEMGVPGQEYFAGTHFNPQVTWWSRAAAFTGYLNRCQFLLQQGQFVADVCCYYGDHVPNFVQLKGSDPARILPGYDYDVCNAEVLIERLAVKDGRLVLPDEMSYRLLVLPDRKMMPVEVLRKVKALVEAGATVIGPRPEQDTGLKDYPRCDETIRALAAEVWGDCDGQAVKAHRAGKGRIVWGKTAREVLAADGVKPDFEFAAGRPDAFLDYIHRRDGETDIYFVANRLGREEEAQCTFRVAGKAPELWDPLTGRIRNAAAFRQADGRTTLPLEFAPYGSIFVVFRRPIAPSAAGAAGRNSPVLSEPHEIAGPWTVKFDPKWGGPESVQFARLESWTKRPEAGVRYYSGTAVYRKVFDLPEALRTSGRRVMLDLGDVKQIAAVRLNGRDLGVLWAMPLRVEATEAAKPAGNVLEVEVTNFWPNRLIGDAALPPEKRLTRTTVALKADTPLLDSGLLGPVVLQAAEFP